MSRSPEPPKPPPVPASTASHNPPAPPGTFISRSAYEPAHPTALAMYCSDGRFTNAVEELLHHAGHDRLDTLTMPGGPGLLNLWSAMFSEMDATSRATSFLISAHKIQHAVLLAHEGCGYYKRRYSSQTAEQLRVRQFEDLRLAARLLRQMHPDVAVNLYFASPENGRVRFDSVQLEASDISSVAPLARI